MISRFSGFESGSVEDFLFEVRTGCETQRKLHPTIKGISDRWLDAVQDAYKKENKYPNMLKAIEIYKKENAKD